MILVTDIIPQFCLPASLWSDNGPEFVSSISQKLGFHIPYHPQSSGKVEHANHTLKYTLTKLSLKLHLDWTKLLPLVLLRLWALPKRPFMLGPFELLYGCPLLPNMVQPEPPNISPISSILSLLFFGLMLMINSHNPLTQPI
jgi:hypothetical protein